MAPHTKQNCTLMDPSFAQGRQVFTDRWVVISGRSGEGARLEDNSAASSPLPGRRRSNRTRGARGGGPVSGARRPRADRYRLTG